jgi:SMI1/KNR4 family protein SUKH-1
MTEHSIYIQSIIDKALDFQNKYLNGLQAPDVWVPEEMIDKTKQSPYKGIIFWKPIPAHISEERLHEYEKKIGFPLPDTYKDFLSYKYFIELSFKHEAEFFRHTYTFVEDYYEHFSNFQLDETLHKGLIPFARETDRGCFCFDVNNVAKGNEYKIVEIIWGYDAQEYPSLTGQFTFIELMKKFDRRLEEWEQWKITSA